MSKTRKTESGGAAMVSNTRRSFLAAAGLLAWPKAKAQQAQPARNPRKPNPYETLAPFADPARDEFGCEKRALATLQRLQNLTAEQRAWRDRYGAVKSLRFYPLAGDRVRYEVANADAKGALHYRTGLWKESTFEPLTEDRATAPKPLFADVSPQLFGAQASFRDQLSKGVPYWRSRLDLATGINMFGNNGIAVGDIDNDGFDEVYVCQPSGLPNRLYKRRASDGAFEDITQRAGVDVLDDTAAALFLDLRNRGLQDLIVLTPSMILLFLNQGDGRFQHVPDAFHFATQPQGTFAGISAADYDRDGKLDLYVCSYLYFQGEDQYRYPVPYHDAQLGPANFLFRNRLEANGGGFFEDVTAATGMNVNNNRYSFAGAWCDYDNSGWPSLYVANDFGRKNLYKNEGGKFRDVAAEAGVEDMGPGMSAAWFDYDGDGRPDLYVANMWSPSGQRVVEDPAFGPVQQGLSKEAFHGHTKGNSLFRNTGGVKFEYTGAKEGVEMGRWAWSADGYDFDLDGTPEIYVTAGMISHSPGKDLMSFFWRQVVSKSPVTQKSAPAYENGWNTINQLVREDWSWNGHEPNVFYVRRDGRYVDYSGVSGLDRALDSRAFAVTDFDGDGIPDLFLKSRLGLQLMAFRNDSANPEVKPLALELEGVRSNRDAIGARVELKGHNTQWVSAGSGYISQHTKRLYFGAGGDVIVRWPSGEKQTFANLEAGFRYRLKEGEAKPVQRAPLQARKALPPSNPVKANNDLVFEPTWLYDVLPLPEKRTSSGPGFVTITEPTAIYSIFRRYIFDYRAPLQTPITFLVDSDSRVHKIYPGVPSAAVKAQDLARIHDSATLALPFPGKFYLKPGRSYQRIAGPFAASGYPQEALIYLNEELKRDPANFKAQLAAGQMQLEANNIAEARRHLEIASRLNPESAELWNNLGGVEMAKPDYAAALRCFEKALAINPDLPFAIINAGQAQNRLGNAVEAEKLFHRALELVPDDADAANHLGLLLAKRGDFAGAVRYLQQAIARQRNHTAAINNLAVLYVRAGKTNDAIAALRFGIEQAPDYDTFYFNLARLYTDLGDKAKARQALEDLLQRKPDQADARRALLQLQ